MQALAHPIQSDCQLQSHWSPRPLAVACLATLGLWLGASGAQAATLEASPAGQQVYMVQLTHPSQPGYPGYPILIDGWSNGQTASSGPLEAFLGYDPVRMHASARTDVGAHHVEATLIGRSRNAAPQLVLPTTGPNPVSIYTPTLIRGWMQQATALSRVTDSFTAAATARAQANLYAASDLRIQLGISEALSSWYGPGGPAYGDINVHSLLSYELFDVTPDAQGNPLRQPVASLSVVSTLLVSGLKLINTTVVNQYSDRFFTYDMSTERSDTVFRDGIMVSHLRDGAGGFSRVMDDSGVALGHTSAGNHTAAFNLVAGHQYEVSTSFYCSVTLGGITAFLQGTNAACDGGRSAYWNGLSDVTDANGQPLEGLEVVSDSGFNYRWANPLSPSPDAILPPSPVPEPGTWALLAAGLVAVVMRARRARAAQA